MAKIFLVSAGKYSSYMIVAAYSTREKADEAAHVYGEAEVEEYEIDPVPSTAMEKRLELYRSGYRAYKIAFDSLGNPKCEIDLDGMRDNVGVWHHRAEGTVVVRGVLARSSDEAIKIANDERAQYLASQRGLGKWASR